MRKMMMTSFLMMVLMTLLTGIVFPLAMTGISLVFFPAQARGSIETIDGKPAGSTLIGQRFTSEKYLHGRPSAAGDKGYDGLSSGGTNLGPASKKLMEATCRNRDAVLKENGLPPGTLVPSDLVFASASGLDPHISPEAAYIQVERIARARGMSPDQVRKVIDIHRERPFLWFIGEPRINVLVVNMALDSLKQEKGK